MLYVGNFKPHKNVPRLLRAWAALPGDVLESIVLDNSPVIVALNLVELAGDRDLNEPGPPVLCDVQAEVLKLGGVGRA